MSWLNLTDSILKQANDTFGEVVVYWPHESPSFEITAIYDESFSMVEPQTGTRIQSTQPRLGVRLSAFPLPPTEGDRVEVRGQVFDVVEYQPDGQGGALLMLHRRPGA